jgi:hypothetical protein
MGVLNATQALALLGVSVESEPAQGARGQAQVRARAIRDTDDEARDALYRSVSQPPARRTRNRA